MKTAKITPIANEREAVMDGQIDLAPNFNTEREQQLFAEFMLGEEAIRFLSTDLGKLMHGYADQEVERIKNQLLKHNPDNIFGRRKINRLRFKAAVARQFLSFIQEAITRGEVAGERLNQERE